MKFFDLHSDFPTTLKLNNVNFDDNVEVVGAVYSGRRTFFEAIEIAKKVKLLGKNVHLGFENIGYFDVNVDEIISLKPIYCSLTYNGENAFGYGCDFDLPLKSVGKSLAKTLADSGIVIDVAHLCQRGVYSLLDVTDKIICSHTALSSLFNHKRNFSDETISNIVSVGGIIGLTPVSYFIAENATLFDFYKHIDYFIQKFGDNNLAIGTDFFGCDRFAGNLANYYDFADLKELIINNGYDKQTVNKIFYYNAKNYYKNLA